MTGEKFLEDLPKLLRPIGLEDKGALRIFLLNPSVIACLAEVMFDRSRLASDLISADLKFYENADKALYTVGKIQGEALGIQRAVLMLFDLAEIPEEETPNDEEEEE